MLFLLRNHEGRGLVLAETTKKSAAEEFGRTHFPDFCGEALEIDPSSRAEAEEFWAVQTVRLVNVPLRPVETVKQYWVRGPVLPPEVEEADLLTMEDRCAITLDHIERTSDFVFKLQIKTRYTQPTSC